MPKEETIQVMKVRSVIGERDDLPKESPRTSLSSRIRALLLKVTGVPQLIHLYGALETNKTLTLDGGENIVSSLFSDGTYLYAGLYTAPGKIAKIDLSTFTKIDTLTLAVGENFVSSLFSDGTYLYAGLYTAPGKIAKIDLSTFTKIDTLTLAVWEDSVQSLFSDGAYLYAGLDTFPGKIIKIDFSTFTKISTLTLDGGENEVYSLFSGGMYLYAGLITAPGKIAKIDLSTFTKIDTLTLAVGENGVYSMFHDGTHLCAGLITTPGKVVKIDVSTFTKISTITFNAGENDTLSLFSDGTYLYAGLSTVPGKIVRRYLFPTSDSHRRRVSLIVEQTHSGRYYVYPALAVGVLVLSNAVAWTKGNYTQIVPASTILTTFYVTGVIMYDMTANTDYEVDIATGAAASESVIATVCFKTDNANLAHECVFPVPIKVSSNTRISSRCADSTGGQTCRIKIRYKS